MTVAKKSSPKGASKLAESVLSEFDPRANGVTITTLSGSPKKKIQTFSASSGKFFVLANELYPEPPPAALTEEVVSATDGDLIELIRMHGGWGYGKRFQNLDNGVNEGIFCLEWVHGLKMVLDNGKKKPVEMNVYDPEYAFREVVPTDTAGKLRCKRRNKKMEEASKIWNKSHIPAPVSLKQVAKAARAATALEQEEECRASALKRKAEARQKKAARNKEARTSQPRNKSAVQEVVEDEKSQVLEDVRGAMHEPVEELPPLKEAALRDAEPNIQEPPSVKEAQLKPQEPPVAEEVDPKTQGKLTIAMHSQPSSSTQSMAEIDSSQTSSSERHHTKEISWKPKWEQQAARLEMMLSSDSGIEKSSLHIATDKCSPHVAHKKMPTRRFTKSLLQAKRTGELEAITLEWERTQREIMNTNQRVKRCLVGANKVGDLESIAEEMAIVTEAKAVELKALKERAFRAILTMTQSNDLRKVTSDMENAQMELEMRAAQLKCLMKRAFQGMRESNRPSELDHIVDELDRSLELDCIADEVMRSECTKERIREAVLRAHRAGQLHELRSELDEMADAVTSPLMPLRRPPPKMWADFSSDSDSCRKSQGVIGGYEDSDSESHSMQYAYQWRK